MASIFQKAKNWCFTLNNPTISENEIIERFEASRALEYLVFQLEAGEQGTPHFQGYVILSARKRLSFLKEILREAHWEVAKGTPKQNRDYCTKPDGRIGEPVEVGVFPETGQGKRSDLAALHSRLKDGLTQAEYANEFFELWIKYPRAVTDYQLSQIPARSETQSVSVICLYGPPRTGKSRLANYLAGRQPGGVYRHSLGEWWDGYCGERCIVFDDFCGSSLSFGNFKRVMDRYPLRVPVKGSSCELAATVFFVTTNVDPRHWWKEEVTRSDWAAIFGRITRVLWFTSENHFSLYSSGYDFEKAFYDPRPVVAHGPILETPIPCTSWEITYPLEQEKELELTQALISP